MSDRGTPYEGSIVYEFTSDSNVDYELVFKSDSGYFPKTNPIASLIYSFILSRLSEKINVSDPRIKATVIYALEAVFEFDPHLVITYQCSAENYQERVRARRFRQWFNENGKDYRRIDSPASSDVYATAIYKKGNPMEELIRASFTEIFYNK